MIEVNLLPGKKRLARGRRRSLSLPKISLPARDGWMVGAVVSMVAVLAWMAWLALSLGPRRAEAEVAIQQAMQDSATYATLNLSVEGLLARRDSIIARVSVIQTVDQGRYIWPHILDEVARALPDYTWIMRLQQVARGDGSPRVRIVGQAGNILALTVFMDQLEASPFLRSVRIIGSTLQQFDQQFVYSFELEFDYETPPLEFLETVPLFSLRPAFPGVAAMDR